VKTLSVNKLEHVSEQPPMEEISALLDGLDVRHRIGELNWRGNDYSPEAGFSIARTSREILLKYYVRETWFKAEKTETNQEVYEDSCVEFFVSPADDGIYYNFEFNAIGTCLMGAGTGRHDRKRADPSVIAEIRRLASAGKGPISESNGDFFWTLTLAIPFSTLFHHRADFSEGRLFRANFYKCGDKLTVPHYLTWNPVGTEKPDFHRPEFFGSLEFA
jgi:hypothetical protein